MPILEFKGKDIIDSYHLGVAFCPIHIDKTKSKLSVQNRKTPSLDDNLIIHGDNLFALKALIPKYAGKIKCVYIDPPYNTGKETWVFNDNVNHPLMREWLKKEVGLDDMERHDKWLCMMWPRLCLLKDLLSEDGVLICAIDHNEREHLGMILKEIFQDQEIVCVTIVHNPRGIQGDHFSYTHEYAYFVLPDKKSVIGKRKFIKNKDISNFRNWGGESLRGDAKNCFYPILVRSGAIVGFGEVLEEGKHPEGRVVKRGDGSYEIWPIDKSGVERKWRYARQSVESIKHLLTLKPAKNQENNFEVEIGKDFGSYKTVWTGSKYDANEYGTKLLKTILPNCPFNFPKSFYTVKDCLQAVCRDDKNAIILDCFAGSGTTAHAVLDMNKEDGGQRKFILVQCEEYNKKTGKQINITNEITAERVRKVMEGYNGKKGFDDSFTYCALGKPLSEENMLKGKSLPDYNTLAHYVFWTATGKTLNQTGQRVARENKNFYIGKSDSNQAFFLIYKPDIKFLRSNESALNWDRKQEIQKIMLQQGCKKAVVFASACFYDIRELSSDGIVFCQLPFAIYARTI